MRIAAIETSTFCNLNCWFCQNAHFERAPLEVMSMELYAKALSQLSAAYTKAEISWIGHASYNEPMADPHFIERLHVLSNAGYTYNNFTNGTMFTEKMVDALADPALRLGPTQINFPGATEGYYKHMVGDKKTSVRRGIEGIHRLADRIPIQHQLNVHGLLRAEHRKQVKLLRKEFARHKNVTVHKDIIVDWAGRIDMPHMEKYNHGGKVCGCLNDKLDNVFISVSGDVYFCCFDYYKTQAYGNINETPLAELAAAREAAFPKMFKSICDTCQYGKVGKQVYAL